MTTSAQEESNASAADKEIVGRPEDQLGGGFLKQSATADDGESVRADRKILFNLYERFGRVTRPYLIHALREERKAISIDVWARAAQSMVNNLRDTLASEQVQSVSSPGSLRDIRRKMKSMLENEREDFETRELDLLVANTSRAIINTWMTDLDKHYKPGMRLSRLLARQSAQKDFLERALAPFPVGDLRDVFVCVLRDFSDDFLAEDTTKVIELPMGLRLVSMVDKTDVGPFEEMIIYRECDLPETLIDQLPNSVREETHDTLPMTHMAAESFILRNIELWKFWIKESVNEQGEEAATKQWFYSHNSLCNTDELHRYASKGQELVRRELGKDVAHVKPTLLMHEMLDNVKHGMQTGESDIEKIVLDESLSLQLKENTFQLNTNEEPSATGSLKWSNVVLFRAMRQALRSSGLMPAAI